jgi:hypothetical protein
MCDARGHTGPAFNRPATESDDIRRDAAGVAAEAGASSHATPAGLLPTVANVVYFADPTRDGFTDVACGLAALARGAADGEDAALLVSGLARLAASEARDAASSTSADDARGVLLCALESLDAAALVARAALAALGAVDIGATLAAARVRGA